MYTRSVSATSVLALTLGFTSLPSHAAQVITDDLVVQASLAVGIDASSGESFGFDTFRLKENNLRVHFEDTSVSPYPSNDWRLIINDSTSGGSNYFAIEDSTGNTQPFRVDAGAATDALRITSNGDIGIGTSSPALDVELKKGDTPAIRLNQSDGGYTPQTWDIAGNEANFFIRDVSGGSLLPFRIRPGAPTSSIDISSAGNVGVGTASPSTKLHVAGDALITGTLQIGSSRQLKENIRELTLADAHKTLTELKPVHFKYKTESEPQLGFIAEDVPDLVATNERKSLVPMDFVAVLTKVVQDQDERVQQLEKQLATRDEMLAKLTARLDALEIKAAGLVSNEIPQSAQIARHDADKQEAQEAPTAAVAIKETSTAPVPELDNGR